MVTGQKYNHEYINYDVRCEVYNGKLTIQTEVLIQINNREGDYYSRISIPFSVKNKIVDLSAHLEDADGKIIRKLKNSEIHITSAIPDMSLYEDRLVKSFILKHNEYPYRIFYSFRETYDEFFSIADWTPVPNENVPTHHAKLTVLLPVDYEVRILEQHVSEASVDTLDRLKKYIWSETYDTVIKEEVFSPSLTEFIPGVKIVPLNFIFGTSGSNESWYSLGKWVSDLNNGLDDLPESEINKVVKLISGISDRKETARILYHYIQDNTRYVSVQIDIGGWKSYPASYVAKNKYGDCKALTTYMKSLLKQAGIESFYALVYADEEPVKLHENFPELKFNHVVLNVPFEHDTLWLDCTQKSSPFGYISTAIQNRRALVIDGTNSHLESIPVMRTDQNAYIRKISYTEIERKNPAVEINYYFRGGYFEYFDELYSESNKIQQEKKIREFVPFNDFELITWELNKANRDSPEIELYLKLRVSNPAKSYGDETLLPLSPLKFYTLETPVQRKLPVRIKLPLTILDTFNFVQTPGLSLSFNDTVISCGSGYYSIQTNHDNHKLEITKKLILNVSDCSLEGYDEFYSFIDKFETLEKRNVLILTNTK